MIIYYLFIHIESINNSHNDNLKNQSYLTSKRLLFLTELHNTLGSCKQGSSNKNKSSVCKSSNNKFLFWIIEKILIKHAISDINQDENEKNDKKLSKLKPISLIEEGEEEEDEDNNKEITLINLDDDDDDDDDEDMIDDFDDNFYKLFGQIIFCLYGEKLKDDKKDDNYDHIGLPIKLDKENSKYLFFSLIYFMEKITKPCKNYTNIIRKVFPFFNDISSDPVFNAAKKSIFEFLNGKIEKIEDIDKDTCEFILSSSSSIHHADEMSDNQKIMEIIAKKCHLLFSSELKLDELSSKQKYDLLINAITGDKRNFKAWSSLADYYYSIVMETINNNCEPSSKYNSNHDFESLNENFTTNYLATIQVLRRTCALANSSELEIKQWCEMGRFYYLLCSYKGKSDPLWERFLNESKKCFEKVQSLLPMDDLKIRNNFWFVHYFLAKIKEKSFYNNSSDFNYTLKMNEILNDYAQAYKDTYNMFYFPLCKLHIARFKFFTWAKKYNILSNEIVSK